MDFEKIKQTMTKEEFLNASILTSQSGCPSTYGLNDKSNEHCLAGECRECWGYAITKGNVKFKDDNTEEQKVINALKVVKNYCDDKELCLGCKFYTLGYCMINKYTKSIPHKFDISELENLIKPQVVIYKVEHSKGGNQYTFVADEDLPVGAMVICDTKRGQSYGKIVDAFEGVDDGNKKCWSIK